jgi:hypothetical protein
MLAEGPGAVRDRVRQWLERQGATVDLAEPDDWSAWDSERRQ